MKIGIITIHNSPNYGASLQSFALYKYLEQCGYDVEIIDLYRPYFTEYIPSRHFHAYKFRNENFKQFIKRRIRSCLCRIKNLFVSKQEIRQSDPKRLVGSEALKKFDGFNAQIRLSRPYRSVDELYKCPPSYDVYMTGSDQVWNPSQDYCLEPYFLTFVRRGRRLSYASSVGIEHLTPREKRDFRRWLRQYDAISVRESSAQKLLQGISGRKIERVADPTFLLDRDYWHTLSVKPEEHDYILIFTLLFDERFIEYGRRLARESGKKLIVLNHRDSIKEDHSYKVVTDAGPAEFLGYVANADMVITDSFHCTVFAILLGANNFYTYIAPWNQRGSRIMDLLHTFGLANHLLDKGLNQSMIELEANTINPEAVFKIYRQEQARSRQYLADNL